MTVSLEQLGDGYTQVDVDIINAAIEWDLDHHDFEDACEYHLSHEEAIEAVRQTDAAAVAHYKTGGKAALDTTYLLPESFIAMIEDRVKAASTAKLDAAIAAADDRGDKKRIAEHLRVKARRAYKTAASNAQCDYLAELLADRGEGSKNIGTEVLTSQIASRLIEQLKAGK